MAANNFIGEAVLNYLNSLPGILPATNTPLSGGLVLTTILLRSGNSSEVSAYVTGTSGDDSETVSMLPKENLTQSGFFNSYVRDNVLFGAEGNDSLYNTGSPTGASSEVMIGGTGNDRFVMLNPAANFNGIALSGTSTSYKVPATPFTNPHVTVGDFVPGEDVIDLSATPIKSFSELVLMDVTPNAYGTSASTIHYFHPYSGMVVSVTAGDVAALNASNFVFNDGSMSYGGQSFTTLNGTLGDDNLVVSSTSNAMVLLGYGNDSAYGNVGNDMMFGGDGADNVIALDGNDSVLGGLGNDTLNGNIGDDIVIGNEGDDWVFGGKGNDSVFGADGNDDINGNIGNDIVIGGQGNDTVHGGQNEDLLIGNYGNDQLYGDLGNDTLVGGQGDVDALTGGDGADVFYFSSIILGTTDITDFTHGVDRLQFNNFTVQQVLDSSHADGAGNTLINIGSGNIQLVGVASLVGNDIASGAIAAADWNF